MINLVSVKAKKNLVLHAHQKENSSPRIDNTRTKKNQVFAVLVFPWSYKLTKHISSMRAILNILKRSDHNFMEMNFSYY